MEYRNKIHIKYDFQFLVLSIATFEEKLESHPDYQLQLIINLNYNENNKNRQKVFERSV